ncbi:MAG TPA: alpha/beta hydrolase, partial [Nakamurella sp.]|nr:alpha/beta hydrolase [Nakamurella sp.]
TLLTYAGWGHTAFLSGNFCVDSTVVSYLITRQTPAAGTVCQPDGSPFGRWPRSAPSRPNREPPRYRPR